jgi:hypothetical protein
MKSNFKFFVVLCACVALLLSSCKDDSTDPAPETRTRKELLMLSSWKLTASVSKTPVDIDGMNGASTDRFIQLKPCEQDNTYKFNADSTTTEVNNTKCKSNEAATAKGTWILSPDQKTLKWNGFDYPIIDITATNLVVKYSFKVGVETYELTDTYSH